ncbi:MAG TPA: alpha/beta hydrolase family protein [Candidatus Sulfotelmatobacter sp.]|nr:alpha/beta hydrolase family protein [Candidatus Sulfotelmatobacter sp.]
MRIAVHRRVGIVALTAFLILLAGCKRQEAQQPDHPRLTPDVILRDVTFHSSALNRDTQYRVVLPSTIPTGEKLQVVYLLHGGGGSFRDWSNYSDVAHFAESRLLLVMPEGGSAYYTNSVRAPQDRYEDYIVSDLIADVERRFPVASGRSNRAIVGVSMGGFGAVKLALRHPELFVFASGISSAIDVPRRAFSIKRLQQSLGYNSIFGPNGSQTRRDSDPFVLLRTADPLAAPYFFLTCGEQEGLLPANREFAALLQQHHFRNEFHTVAGDHNWNQWKGWLPSLFQSLTEHLNARK